nr:E2 [Erethizon dorsatum papillomavirus 2]
MQTLEGRYNLLQEQLLNLFEKGSSELEDQIQYWDLQRQEQVLLHYARKQHRYNIGMVTVPSLSTSEHNAKVAIKLGLLLKSLAKSRYGREPWSMQETSSELVLDTKPKGLFKKEGTHVDVWYDKDPENGAQYVLWKYLYKDTEQGWVKLKSQVDYYGIYYKDETDEKIYYTRFDEDGVRYSTTGTWIVHFQNDTISSSREERDRSETTGSTGTQTGRSERPPPPRSRGAAGGGGGERRRRSIEQAPNPKEVGQRRTSVPKHNLSSIQRLNLEARDPPVLILKGRANALKCWRHRQKRKGEKLYVDISTTFAWSGCGVGAGVGAGARKNRQHNSRLLVAFADSTHRDLFLKKIPIPKGCTYDYGNLSSL